MLVCVSFYHLARETAGAARTRSSLRPLISMGANEFQNPGENAPRHYEGVSNILFPPPLCGRAREGGSRIIGTARVNPSPPPSPTRGRRSAPVTPCYRCRHALSRHRPRKRASQYAETPVMESRNRGVWVPAFAGTTP